MRRRNPIPGADHPSVGAKNGARRPSAHRNSHTNTNAVMQTVATAPNAVPALGLGYAALLGALIMGLGAWSTRRVPVRAKVL